MQSNWESELLQALNGFSPGADTPVYQQLVDRLQKAIMLGQIRLGTRLPSERHLARKLNLSRTTVQTAYRELESLGFLQIRSGSGAFVRARPDFVKPTNRSSVRNLFARRLHTVSNTFLRDATRETLQEPRYSFETGMPDYELLPVQEFQLLIDDLFARNNKLLSNYSTIEGLPSLRDAIAKRLLPLRGLGAIDPDEVLVTTGSTQALDLLAKLFVEDGDVVAVGTPTFPGAIQVFRAAGAQVVGVPVDGHGLCVSALEELLTRCRVKLLYVQPALQNPTGAVLAPERRLQLLHLASRHGMLVIEDDAYGLLADAETSLPAKADDTENTVVYLGTFSKFLAPGFRVGYVVAHDNIIRHLASLKQLSDVHTGNVSQLLLDGWLSTGDVEGHLRRSRTAYRDRLEAALREVRDDGSLQLYCEPRGGYHLFCRLPAPLTSAAVRARCAAAGIYFLCGDLFAADGTLDDYLRLCVSSLPPPAIQVGLRRLSHVVRELMVASR